MIKREIIIWLTGVCLTATACKSNQQTTAIDVVGHIKGDLRLLDSIPYGILKITEKGNQKPDSAYIKKADMWQLVTPFLSDEIRQDNLTDDYTETSFADATIHSVMITYEAKDKEHQINQIAVYVSPESGKINRIYITGFFDNEKWKGKKQLLWTGQKGITIISSREDDQSGSETITERIIWQ